jgi:Transcriptional regulator, AbiEi antitoxin, Type IV TA system
MPDHNTKLLEQFVAELLEATSMSLVHEETEVPFTSDDNRVQLDARLRVTLSIGDDVELAIEVMRAGYPRDVRLAVHRLHAYQAARLDSKVPVALCVLADYLSPGSRKELRQAGINYYDGTGSMHFKHGTYLVMKEREPPNRPPRRPVKLFSGAREQVVHALLEHWRQTEGHEYISGAELAERAQTSTYTVSLTMQEFEREDWVEATGKGPSQRRRVSNATGMLDAWADDWTSRRQRVTRWYIYAPQSNPTDTLLSRLANRQGWALTGAAAANTVVPHLTSVDRVQVIVPRGQAEAWGQEFKLKQVDKGANVVFIERAGASLMFLDEHPEQPGSRFASRFIQYLDLLDNYGRNKELATEFRRRALKMEPSE